MLALTLSTVLLFGLQQDIPQGNQNLWIKHSDLVVVARYMSYAGMYTAEYGESPGNLDREGVIETLAFDLLLTAYGEHPGSTLTGITMEAESPEEFWSDGQVGLIREGSVYLMFLRKPTDDLLVRFSALDLWFRAASSDHYDIPLLGIEANAIKVPDITYRAEGTTPVEAFVSILSQAFAVTKDLKLLQQKILGASPNYKFVDGRPVVTEYVSQDYRGFYDGPTYFSFFASTIKPRLLEAAGDDTILKLHIYDAIVRVGDRSVRPEQRELVLHVDRTWPDPDLRVPAGTGDEEWAKSLLTARLATFRAQGVMLLPKEQRRSNLVLPMLDDESEGVRTEAVWWFERAYSREMKADPDAPRLRMIRDGRRNFEDDLRQSVEYWKRKIR